MSAGVEIVLSLFFVVVAAVYGILTRRFIRTVRAGDEEWRRKWRALEPARRRAIARTTRQGRPLREPEDVELALRAIAQLDYVRAAMRPLELFLTPVLGVLVIVATATGLTFIAIAGGVGLAGNATLHVLAWQRRRQLQRSAQSTRHFTDI